MTTRTTLSPAEVASIVYPKTRRLFLNGPIPSKKNLWKRGVSGRMYIPSDVGGIISVLIAQARSQWKGAAWEHPEMTVEFLVLDRRSDRDNALTCLLDVFQKAGILVNDNVAHFNGKLTLMPAVVGNREGAIVDITEPT